ncbi:hypothetical protein JZ751_003039, partial [Albula glossodonta]
MAGIRFISASRDSLPKTIIEHRHRTLQSTEVGFSAPPPLIGLHESCLHVWRHVTCARPSQGLPPHQSRDATEVGLLRGDGHSEVQQQQWCREQSAGLQGSLMIKCLITSCSKRCDAVTLFGWGNKFKTQQETCDENETRNEMEVVRQGVGGGGGKLGATADTDHLLQMGGECPWAPHAGDKAVLQKPWPINDLSSPLATTIAAKWVCAPTEALGPTHEAKSTDVLVAVQVVPWLCVAGPDTLRLCAAPQSPLEEGCPPGDSGFKSS